MVNVEVSKVHTVLKCFAEDNVEKPSLVISEMLANVSQVTLGLLPDASAMRKMNKCRRKVVSSPVSRQVGSCPGVELS